MANSNLTQATASAFSQLAVGIDNFLALPPAGTPPGVRDTLDSLLPQVEALADTLSASAIAAALSELENPAKTIEKFTKKINAAIVAIQGRDQALQIAAGAVSSLTSAIASQDPGKILKIVEGFIK